MSNYIKSDIETTKRLMNSQIKINKILNESRNDYSGIPNWHKTSDRQDLLIDHYFYLVTHPDYGTPMKAKYHDDLGGYFEIVSSEKKETIYINPIFGKCKCKYFMPTPEMPDDYKEELE